MAVHILVVEVGSATSICKRGKCYVDCQMKVHILVDNMISVTWTVMSIRKGLVIKAIVLQIKGRAEQSRERESENEEERDRGVGIEVARGERIP